MVLGQSRRSGTERSSHPRRHHLLAFRMAWMPLSVLHEFPVCRPALIPSPTGLWLLNPNRTNTVFRFAFAQRTGRALRSAADRKSIGSLTTIQIVTGDGTTVQVEDRNAVAAKSYYRLVKLP